MKRVLVVVLVILGMPIAAEAQEYVSGYLKSDGTYVQGYYRSKPNGTTADNYSTKGNVNPYTGKSGTKEPTYTAPSYSPPRSSYQPAPLYSPPSNSSYNTPSYTPPRSSYRPLPQVGVDPYSVGGY